ncbi:DUF6783 domain-containing protein [Robinsoniella sp. KNHs210]|uniref:DUF6783 domain-containing protein n=1 Tax=Robinsoniella sp. KNHs210 TaxID=1469950 RepID=UPI003FA7E333
MCVTLFVEFVPVIQGAAGCTGYLRSRFHVKRGVQMAGINFQTGSGLDQMQAYLS